MIVIEAPSEGHVGFPRVACEEALFLGAGQRGPQEVDTRKEEALLKPKRVPGPQTDRRRACSDERAPQRRSILVRNKDLVACFTGVAGALDVTRDAQRITFERRPPEAPNVGTFAERNPATVTAANSVISVRDLIFEATDATGREKLRDEFLSQRGCTDAGEIETLLAGAAEVEDLLRNNVVQGRRQEASGAFKFKVKGASGEDEFAHRAEPVDDLEIALAEAELEGKKS